MKIYSVAEVAELFGAKSEWWLREGCRFGRFPHLRVGREIRFTEQHVKEITAAVERRPAREPDEADTDTPSVDEAPTELAFRATKRSTARRRARDTA